MCVCLVVLLVWAWVVGPRRRRPRQARRERRVRRVRRVRRPRTTRPRPGARTQKQADRMARRLAVREFQRRQKQAQEDPYYEPLGGPGALAGLSKAWEDSRLGLGDDEDDDEDYDEDDDEDEEGALILLAQAATAPGSGGR